MSLLSWYLLLGLSAIWGASFWFVEIGLEQVSVFTLVLFRVSFGSLALLVFFVITRRPLPFGWHFWRQAAVMGLFNNVLPFCLIAWGQLSITAGMASILNAHTAFAAVWISALFIASEKLRLNRLIGVLTGIVGVVLVIGPHNLAGAGQSGQLWGQLAVIAATLCYALAGVWAKLRMSGQDGLSNALAMLICATLWLAPLVLWLDGLPDPALFTKLDFMAAMVTLGLAGTALAYWAYFRILKEAGPANLGLVTIIVPVFAVLIDALVLGMIPAARTLGGFGVVAAGLVILDGRLTGLIRQQLGRQR